MARPVARYSISFGLQGCYMPDSTSGPYAFHTRRELAEFIRNELRMYDLPARLFHEVRIRRLWSFIKTHGSSTAHFHLAHGHNALSFHGLTQDEYDQQERDQE